MRPASVSMPNAKTAREIVIRFISGGPTRIDEAKCAENKLKSCVRNSDRNLRLNMSSRVMVMARDANFFIKRIRIRRQWSSESDAKPRKFGPRTSDGCSACHEMIRSVVSVGGTSRHRALEYSMLASPGAADIES